MVLELSNLHGENTMTKQHEPQPRRDLGRLKEFSSRFNDVLDQLNVPQLGDGRQRVVGEMFKVSQVTARNWLDAQSYPGLEQIDNIARRLNVRADWLISGEGPIERGNEGKKSSLSPSVTLSTAELPGAIATAQVKFRNHQFLALDIDALGDEMKDASHEVSALLVESEEMDPTIKAGDILILDTRPQSIDESGIYVLSNGSESVAVRRIQRRLSGGFTLHCDNPRYQDETVDHLAINGKRGPTVVARVLWTIKRIAPR
jgi:phage repressor protein C with HTH and peptisase S24 domain